MSIVLSSSWWLTTHSSSHLLGIGIVFGVGAHRGSSVGSSLSSEVGSTVGSWLGCICGDILSLGSYSWLDVTGSTLTQVSILDSSIVFLGLSG